jgi:hypothetical protein
VKLHNARLAVVEQQKVVDYLLNSAHADNSGKARFFESLGFSIEEPERLVAALRALAERSDVVESVDSVHGKKYIVEGWLSAQTEESRQRLVRSIWIIDRGHEAPRLVTAYPGKE